MVKRKALLYSYSDDKNYEVWIDENTDINSDSFEWENILLEPIEGICEGINTENGVSWGWA